MVPSAKTYIFEGLDYGLSWTTDSFLEVDYFLFNSLQMV